MRSHMRALHTTTSIEAARSGVGYRFETPARAPGRTPLLQTAALVNHERRSPLKRVANSLRSSNDENAYTGGYFCGRPPALNLKSEINPAQAYPCPDRSRTFLTFAC